ncbi:MAG: T9SS type A sorting domain-containing protein [Ignavibacteriaceae bacterium]
MIHRFIKNLILLIVIAISISFRFPDFVLPVELIYFVGYVNGNFVDLRWGTATEVSNYGFDVHRTQNFQDWETLGFVEGNGNSNSPKHYSFLDSTVSPSGVYYYRLKQIDTDGQFAYSDTIAVNFATAVNEPLSDEFNYNIYGVYPNPMNPSCIVNFSLPFPNIVKIELYTLLGEKISTLTESQFGEGDNSLSLNLSDYTSGIYLLYFRSGSFTKAVKISLIK